MKTGNKWKWRVELEFSEKNHSLIEHWWCDSANGLKKKLGEALDLVRNPKTRIPVEPDPEKITENLSPYAEPEYIKNDVKRQKKNYAIYCTAVKAVEGKSWKRFEIDVDLKTWLRIDRFKRA